MAEMLKKTGEFNNLIKQMKLKYLKEINGLPCELDSFSEQDRISFRWVFTDINDTRNFEPVYKDAKRQQTTCCGFALSFYDEQKSAKKRLLELTKDKENLFKKLGTHIAVGNLEKKDGISNKSNSKGHFEHFEYDNIVLNTKFEIVEKVAI
ncbi:hypothetical protein ABF174_002331 [Flavobacterium psychrophilum]